MSVQITGLLRWPAASGGGVKMPIVRTSGRQLTLLADCAEHFIARTAAEADADGAAEATDLTSLVSATGMSYERGAAATSPGGLPGYLITKVGPFISAYEQLAAGHLKRGAQTGTNPGNRGKQ